MKKIIIMALLMASCVAIAGTNFKKVIIGTWDAVEFSKDGQVKYQIIVDGKTFVTIKNGVTETSRYTISGDRICLTGDNNKCMELVYVSDDELYMPSENVRMTRAR